MDVFFPYDLDWRFVALWGPFGLRPGHDGVRISEEGELVATFGFLRVSTPLANVSSAHVTSNYRWWTAVGARLSFADDGLTFGTNARAGVCVHFANNVRSPLRRRGHSALTVTVRDLTGLIEALETTASAS